MVRLTAAYVSSLQQDGDVEAIEKLDVSGKQISDIVDLDKCSRLTRLDLSNNVLTSIEGLKLCSQLKWLSLAGNQLDSLSGISALPLLTVLNCSHNKLTSINEVGGLHNLRALILNNNEIETIGRVDRLKNLDTLVLSKNKIREIGRAIGKLTALSKLSLSNNRIQTLGVSLKSCILLEELRLAHNSIRSLPMELEFNGRLRIVDLCNNRLQNLSDIEVLSKFRDLAQVNLRGNPICEGEGYNEKMCGLLPMIEVLDSKRLRGRKRRAPRIHASEKDYSSTFRAEEPSITGRTDVVAGQKLKSEDGYGEDGGTTDARKKKAGKSGDDIVFRVENEKGKGKRDGRENVRSDRKKGGIEEDSESKPFIELVMLGEDMDKELRTVDGKRKISNNLSTANSRKPGSKVLEVLTSVVRELQDAVGMGGESAWGDTTAEAKSQLIVNPAVSGDPSQATQPKYNRWKKKGT